ncbi:ParB/RepB/Spo0J family partition protein [Burkholderia multivorans]|jgi:ParB family chromosome partitioning protein|uniref:ParB/RepB/Spo0J family partition protein n=1 Tax=Burkholderia multivorans TaxID=87883 RepID=UPI0009E0D1B4|nr:ParB/RepB/Spo0J family partition protein [Burkholderia multivorans]MCA8501205.1 ParB/RepB/Spo0J family partition protein [Burkholderia multivorans]MDN8080828.1 ParB/RepB/Spo0J family partition protein [Burkholderia multivorans]PRE17914.1 ParB/RepB/Spo0J family partition protein [Burkholderia multivorans]PRG44486.1 ParB/RepB/Spo0J family partition protein [Burkholderia multivorans]SAJ96658.1 ParB/RepB/Spo0J family partition domain protein [Burkholderia multivorans]
MAKDTSKEKKPTGNLHLAAGLLRGLAQENAALETRIPEPPSAAKTGVGAAVAAAPGVTPPDALDLGAPQRVAVKDCIPNPFNPRVFYSESSLHELALTLKREGQIEPIKVTRLPEFPGKLVVIDGQRRLRATSINGDETINATFRTDHTPEQLYTIAYRANHDHERQTIFDDAVAWKRLLDEKVFPDQNTLAEKIGKDKASISKTLSLNALPNTLLERMAAASDIVGLQAAYFLKLIFERLGEATADRLLTAVIDRKKSVRDLENFLRAQSDDTKKAGRTRYSVRHDFALESRAIGQLKTYPDGRLDLQLKGVDATHQEALADKLKAVIDEYVATLAAAQP